MFRPLRFCGLNSPALRKSVLFEVARSAEPPIRLGIVGASALSTRPDATRVAIVPSSALKVGKLASHPGGNSRRSVRCHSAARSGWVAAYDANRDCHAASQV